MRHPVVLASGLFIVIATACGGSSSTGETSSSDDGGSGSSSGGGGGGADARADSPTSGGGDAGSGVGTSGGTASHLLFTVVGDTRPGSENDISGYPTAIIDKIYQDVAALQPLPLFSISTGDYQFSSKSGGYAEPQLQIYLAARAKFPGPFFPAMGNHECTGSTDSNCGPGNTDGETDNYNAFMTQLLGPIHQTKPYYAININATDGSWTSKFVFIAANAWDSGQATWLQTTLAQKTTYTFVVRHESSSANTAPGVTPSDTILASSKYTMLILGHSHTVERPSVNQVIFGNGGAPISGTNVDYGYGLFTQRADGSIQVDSVDYMTNKPDPSFTFALKADGTLAQ